MITPPSNNPECAGLIGGYGIAKQLVLEAIAAGKHVVTANKALLAVHGTEIFAAASAKGVMVAFEAAVAGGIPIIKALREGLTANRIQWIAGIINGTTNFILIRDARQGPGTSHRRLWDCQAAGAGGDCRRQACGHGQQGPAGRALQLWQRDCRNIAGIKNVIGIPSSEAKNSREGQLREPGSFGNANPGIGRRNHPLGGTNVGPSSDERGRVAYSYAFRGEGIAETSDKSWSRLPGVSPVRTARVAIVAARLPKYCRDQKCHRDPFLRGQEFP
ncbi:hypothetical protein [Mycobacterium tuberculosis]|uniref:hypothetical protein n=1 Tax=Mycobacterium tuberculosis TaxID=1773 RepID=UPI00272D2D88|nr:hypothetical protein [Mycobacterium tuberculosis]